MEKLIGRERKESLLMMRSSLRKEKNSSRNQIFFSIILMLALSIASVSPLKKVFSTVKTNPCFRWSHTCVFVMKMKVGKILVL